MTLRSGDLQWESDLDSICNSCDVFGNWQLACLSMNISAFKNHEDDAAIKINKSKEFWRNAGKERWKYMTILKQEFRMRDNSWNWSKLMVKGKNYGICWFCMVVGDQPKGDVLKGGKECDGMMEWPRMDVDQGPGLLWAKVTLGEEGRRMVVESGPRHQVQPPPSVGANHPAHLPTCGKWSIQWMKLRTLFVFICLRQFVTRHQQSPTRLLCGRLKISSPRR